MGSDVYREAVVIMGRKLRPEEPTMEDGLELTSNPDMTTVCGAFSQGYLCSYSSHQSGPHSWEPIDSEDVKVKRGELHPEYYQTESGMQPWDVIKAFRLDYWKGTVVAYLCRAGRKSATSEIEDVRKAWTFLGEHLRELEKHTFPYNTTAPESAGIEPTVYCHNCSTNVPMSEFREHND